MPQPSYNICRDSPWYRTGVLPGAGLTLLALLLVGCSPEPGAADAHAASTPQSTDEQKTLVVVTRNAPTSWYYDRDNRTAGPEHDRVQAFARDRGLQVEWVVETSVSGVLTALHDGDAQMAAAGLTHLDSRDERFLRGPRHSEVTEQVVCHRDQHPMPRSAEDLAAVELVLGAGSSYVETIEALRSGEDATGPNYREATLGTERLLAAVAEREIECTVADSNIVEVNRRAFPHLEIAFDLSPPRAIGWYIHPDHPELADQTRTWMDSEAGRLARERVEELYYAYIDGFDFVDLRALSRRIDRRLPDFRPYFERAADQYELAPDLLAALAYQESHWDPEARSPTGVRGLMMLTQRTAEALGVSNRLDPEQSIEGGARYLHQMHRRLPEDIAEPDRTYLALASYNIGRGHLLDARKLARQLGKDPDRWADMREVLPLLTEERYYKDLRYGYARGYQPVYYVQRIRNYRDVIRPVFAQGTGMGGDLASDER